MLNLKKPWLNLPAKVAHDLSLPFLKFYGQWAAPQTLTWNPLDWRGLHFPNRLGPAGGTDKNADLVKAWWSLGAGFVEVGTITPLAQEANPGEILNRDTKSQTVWNKMGFPNAGAAHALAKMNQLPKPFATPVFVNIGKNRQTPNEKATDDYLTLLKIFSNAADVFVVNISSPNTAGLRELLKPENLKPFLAPLVAAKTKPLLLKLSPDLNDDEFKQTLDISLQAGVDGWVLTNTTLAREEASTWPKDGGISGRPLAEKSKAILKLAVQHLGNRRDDKLIVSVGGVLTPADVIERLRLGANLVQVYSTLIFEGPGFFRKVSDAYV